MNPAERVRVGSHLAALSRQAGVTSEDVRVFEEAMVEQRAATRDVPPLDAAGLRVVNPGGE